MPFDGTLAIRPSVDSSKNLLVSTNAVSNSSSEIDAFRTRANGVISHHYDQGLLAKVVERSNRRFFRHFMDILIDETQWQSSISAITQHSAFVELVGMGPVVTKLVLERIVAGEIRVIWFPLLKRIVGSDPVPPHYRGQIEKMSECWIDWGKKNGHLAV